MISLNFQDNYHILSAVVHQETSRLHSDYFSKHKIEEINKALCRLSDLIKFLENPSETTLSQRKFDLTKYRYENLSCTHAMLNIKIYEWDRSNPRHPLYVEKKSLSDALNLSRYNFFSILSVEEAAWWGQTTSLKNVLEKLS